MSRKEFLEILKSITLGDIIGALSLFIALFIGLFWILLVQ